MLAAVRNIVMKVEKARLYRGRGGEIMRDAVCVLIKSIALAGHELSARAQLRLLDSIHETIVHPKVGLVCVCVCFHALARSSCLLFAAFINKCCFDCCPNPVLPILPCLALPFTTHLFFVLPYPLSYPPFQVITHLICF